MERFNGTVRDREKLTLVSDDAGLPQAKEFLGDPHNYGLKNAQSAMIVLAAGWHPNLRIRRGASLATQAIPRPRRKMPCLLLLLAGNQLV